VVVSDTGIGVSDEMLPYIFGSFSQADSSTTRRFGGTGLGLSISRDLCELMSGGISVQSKLGEGSTFQFSVKLTSSSAAETLKETPCSTQYFTGLRVLLVEDNIVNQQVMLAILKDLEVSVDVANDGLEALEMLGRSQSAAFDLILMDCQMPNLDGYETTRRIRAGDAGEVFRLIPIAALTANAMSSERKKCFDAGMNDHLTKPINTHALKAMLAKCQRV
jgi:CheY-like chemotaxis protein